MGLEITREQFARDAYLIIHCVVDLVLERQMKSMFSVWLSYVLILSMFGPLRGPLGEGPLGGLSLLFNYDKE